MDYINNGTKYYINGFVYIVPKNYYANEIMEFVSYSSAILSITLSIFAIQYTYTSNVQIQQQFEKINSVADNIRGTANKLNLTSGKLEENLEVILKQLENIDASQKEMSSRINNLNNTQVGVLIFLRIIMHKNSCD